MFTALLLVLVVSVGGFVLEEGVYFKTMVKKAKFPASIHIIRLRVQVLEGWVCAVQITRQMLPGV